VGAMSSKLDEMIKKEEEDYGEGSSSLIGSF
jgi:hypothetical protein